MYIKASKKTQFLLDIVMVCLGTIVMGFAFSFFLSPNNISTGGFSGLAMIINELLSKIGITFLSNAVIYFILNIGLFLYAMKTLGRKFAIKSLIAIIAYSLFMQVFEFIPVCTYEPLISAIYGGILMGCGVGLVVRFGASTGGGDMIASIVRRYKPNFSIGQIVIIIDAFVVLASMIVFPNGLEILPYTIVALAIAVYATDFVNDGYKKVKAYYIITNNPDAVSAKIMEKLHRGCTMQKAIGMHEKAERYILTCLVSKYQTTLLRRIVKDIDESAFVYATSVNEVIGSWANTEEVRKNTEGLDTIPNEKKTKKNIKKNNSVENNSTNTDK